MITSGHVSHLTTNDNRNGNKFKDSMDCPVNCLNFKIIGSPSYQLDLITPVYTLNIDIYLKYSCILSTSIKKKKLTSSSLSIFIIIYHHQHYYY